MAILGVDVQLFSQTVLYFAGALGGFVAAIPIGVTMSNFGGNCILYGNNKWINKTNFQSTYGGTSGCNFPIYASVFGCIVYGVIMGSYHTYAICRGRKDPSIGSQLWVMPFLMINALVTVVLFISSCMVSVGLSQWCRSLVEGANEQANKKLTSCAIAQTYVRDWNLKAKTKYDGSTFYDYLTVAQVASWLCTLVGLLQTALCVLRLYRNRRARSQGQIQADPNQTSDTQDISRVEPTA